MRRRAIDVLRRILDLVEPLRPSTCTLHLTPAADLKTIDQIVLWRDRLCEDLSGILSGGFSSKRLAVENLFYPFEWTEPVIDRLELCVCMDAGHLMVAGADPAVFFEKWERRIPIMHLHGVKGNQDHLGLDQLDSVRMEMMRRMLFRYHGTVSIEVFSFPALSLSLTALEKAWKTQTSET
jgi:sugar phosphate isomerase/epimerase